MTNLTLLAPLSAALLVAGLMPSTASAQLGDTLLEPGRLEASMATLPLPCTGRVKWAEDTTFENVQTTGWSYGPGGGGGIGGYFDATPVLSKTVDLTDGCLNAHLSTMVGSSLTYGRSRITLFEVTLTSLSTGAVVAMDGHYPTCYRGVPCVALSAEYDVDMLGANFYKAVGKAPGQVPPGLYDIKVWWAGGPAFLGGGVGALGAAFVLKAYHH
jgi:hypothetical protein